MIVEKVEEQQIEIDTRTCVYTWHCLKIDCIQRDAEYHIVFCSVECQERYTRHRKRAWCDVSADSVSESELPVEFEHLWRLHVSLTRQIIMAAVRPGGAEASVHRLREAISHNNRAIGRLFAVTHGRVFGEQVTGLLNEHAVLTLRVLEELTQRESRPISISQYTESNVYFDEWVEQALDTVRFVYERLAPDSNDETAESQLEAHMRNHLLFTLEEMLHEVNGDRTLSLDLYKQDDAEINRVSQTMGLYLGMPQALRQRESNRAFSTMWRAHARILCEWLQLSINSAYDESEKARASLAAAVLRENVTEIAMNAFIVKYGGQFSQSFQALYVAWLRDTEQLINSVVTQAPTLLNSPQPCSVVSMGNNPVYTAWLESMSAMAQLLDQQMTSSVVVPESSLTESRGGGGGGDIYDYLRVYRELVLRFIVGVVCVWQRMTLSPSSLLSLSMRGVSIGDSGTSVATANLPPSPDETRTELENECGRLADYMLGFIDQ